MALGAVDSGASARSPRSATAAAPMAVDVDVHAQRAHYCVTFCMTQRAALRVLRKPSPTRAWTTAQNRASARLLAWKHYRSRPSSRSWAFALWNLALTITAQRSPEAELVRGRGARQSASLGTGVARRAVSEGRATRQ